MNPRSPLGPPPAAPAAALALGATTPAGVAARSAGSGPNAVLGDGRRRAEPGSRGVGALLAAGLVAALATGCSAGARPAPAPPSPPAPPAPARAEWRPARAPIMTRWAAEVRPDSALPEYPRPQLVRPRWRNLNGLWEFAVVDTNSMPGAPEEPLTLARPSVPGGAGPEGPLPAPDSGAFAGQILVPFAPEAALSGVGRHADRIAYRRRFQRPDDMAPGERLLLHVGACDWHCTVYVNGRQVADHTGGYDAFSVDVTEALRDGAAGGQELVIAVYDPTDRFGQPRGKQVSTPGGIWYTPVTGIWQTVWLEPVPAARIGALRMTPDVAGGALGLTVRGEGTRAGQRVEVVASANGQVVGRAEGAPGAALRIPVPNPRLWGPDDPFLYDLAVTLRDGGRVVDSVGSYFGMRAVGKVRDARGFDRIALNGQPVFQLGPLDQGWWPDGLYTAPTDAALRSDLEVTKQLGFNMTRKHIKVEPARWYYHADRLGIPVWQDMPSGWNDTPESRRHFEAELREMLAERHNHPSIVVWVPFNEKWGQFDVQRIVGIVEQADSSRLVNDVSGWQHENVGDIIDVHRYQGPQAMRGANGRVAVVGEFGGLGYKAPGHTWAGDAWGYGGLFETPDSLAARYDLLLKRLYRDRDTHGMGAGVYTQLTDVEVELNGFLTYDRAVMKFDTARVAAVNRGYAPYVLPELPELVDSVRVTIVQGTPTEVRYTLDGSEPTARSARYDAPFTLRQDATLRARAFADGRPVAGAPEARTDFRRVAGRTPLAAAAARRVVPGLHYELFADTTAEPAFRMNWPVRWQLERPEARPNDLPPKKTGTVATVTLAPADTNELFGMRYTGYVRVPRRGVYTFTALSDDGAGLWVGDRNVFWSLGQSPKTTETSGELALAAGLHPITLTYFQAYGPLALELYVEGPGMPRQRVPASMLFRDPRLRSGERAATTPSSR